MLQKEERVEVWALRRQGYSNRWIARKLGIHRKTMKRYLQGKEFPAYRSIRRRSGLEVYHRMIKDRLSTEDYQATRVHDLVGARISGSHLQLSI